MLADLLEQDSEYHNGRLNIFPNLWRWAINVPAEIQQRLDSGEKRVIVRDEADNGRVTGWFENRDRDGRVVEMVTGQCVICPNVDLWPDAYPHRGKGDEVNGRWVKMSDCRKCEHYRKTTQTGLRYASCHWAKLTRSGKKPLIRQPQSRRWSGR